MKWHHLMIGLLFSLVDGRSTLLPTQYEKLDTCLLVLRNGKVPAAVDSQSIASCKDSDTSNQCGSQATCNDVLHRVTNIFSKEDKIAFIHIDDVQDGWLFDSIYSQQCSTQQPNCSLIIYTKPEVDRTCLMSPPSKTPPKPIVVDVTLSKDDINGVVKAVNKYCHTFRDARGRLTYQGLHHRYIMQNLFSVRQLPNYVKSEEIFGRKQLRPDALPRCERVTIESWDQFFINYLQISKPVIIASALSSWNASRWSNKYLKDKYGNRSVHIKLSPTTDYEGIERAELWDNFNLLKIPEKVRAKLQFPDLVVPRPAPVNMRFADYIKLMENIAVGMVTNASAYLEYSSIREYFPELEQDISEMKFLDNKMKLKHLNLWLSDGNTLGKLHFDPFDNFLCMIDGRKELTLFEPHNNTKLYEAHIPEAQFSVDLKNYLFRRSKLLESTSMVMSPFDIKKPDFERFPMFKDTLPLNCTIDEGDVLFMPAFWWHEVQSYPNPIKKRNLAVNYWYTPFFKKDFPCAECNLEINHYYHNLL